MSVTLPALRERTDTRIMVAKLAATETASRGLPVKFSEGALQAIERYSWPGNIRQLFNVIRVAIALLDDDETLITETHLPEELFEPPLSASDDAPPIYDPWAAAPLEGSNSLDAISRQAAMRALEAAGGNISSAARQLGISRNTLYRKLGRM
jgi:transcriptional regulator of acetoin/glycerol metabolism